MIANTKYFLLLLFLGLLTACATNSSSHKAGAYTNGAALDGARAHTNLGAAYLQQNKLEIALEEFTKATQILPSFAMAYNGLAMVRSALKQDEEAEYNFKKAIQLDPSISAAYNNYGAFLCDRGRYTESIEQFMQAVKNPLYTTPNLAYANAGICAELSGDIASAEQHLNKALEIQPLTHFAAYRLADIQFKRGDVVAAKITMRNALVASPNAEMLWLGIRIERLVGDKDNEASYALQLRNRFPSSKETKLLLNRN